MNIEESIRELKGYLTWLEANGFSKLAKDSAIETLLTAYEKEKETSHYIQSQLDIANAKLVEEKEKNKDLKEGYKIQEHNYQVAMEEIEQRWEDKIKAKIEWLDKEGYFEFLSNRDILKCHNILASLLEKE